MIIVNREKFLLLPPGTLYSRYEPCIVSGLEIKGKSFFFEGGSGDWFFQNILGEIGDCWDCAGNEEEMMAGIDVELNLKIQERDGGFEADELFLIYTPKDIRTLITKIKGD